MIRFACPTCGKHLKAADRGAGMKVSCTRCGQRLQIPAAAAPPAVVQNRTVLGEPLPALASSPPAPAPGPRPTDATPPPRQVRANCPGCGREIRLAVGELGTLIECARCGTRFVPAGAPAPAPGQRPAAPGAGRSEEGPEVELPEAPPANEEEPEGGFEESPAPGRAPTRPGTCPWYRRPMSRPHAIAVTLGGGLAMLFLFFLYALVAPFVPGMPQLSRESDMSSVNVGHFIDHTPSYRGRTITLPLHTSLSMPGTLRDHRGHELKFWNYFLDGKLEMLILIPPGLDVPAVVSGDEVMVTFRCQGDLQLGNVAVEIRRRAND
jgi:DNA-directed RNA polymerase subunit RPC12/RpoP